MLSSTIKGLYYGGLQEYSFMGCKTRYIHKCQEFEEVNDRIRKAALGEFKKPAIEWNEIPEAASFRYFIADFYCHEKKLVIELDGEIHDKKEQMEYDDGRSFELEEKGFKILRFRNEEVINDIQSVLKRIIEATT